MISLSRRALVLPALTAVLLTACAPPGADNARGDSSRDAGSLQVLASFYPLQYVSEQVGGDRVSVTSVTPPGAGPHDLELSPAKVAEMADASVVVYASGFQAAVDEAVEHTRPGRTIDVAGAADLSPLGDHSADSAEAGRQDAGNGGSRAPGAVDPHFWLDLERLADVTALIARRFAEIDPENADTYQANAQELTRKLSAADAEFARGLATCDRRTIVVAHEAYGYLADRYDLEQAGVSGIDPEAEPAPARIAKIRRIIEDEDVTTIFTESLVNPKVAETLASDLGVKTSLLDPLESQTDPGGDYLDVVRDNLTALRAGLGCE